MSHVNHMFCTSLSTDQSYLVHYFMPHKKGLVSGVGFKLKEICVLT